MESKEDCPRWFAEAVVIGEGLREGVQGHQPSLHSLMLRGW